MAESKEDSITDAQFATNPAVIPLQNPLWDYACGVYSQAGVEAELLVLQDEHGADINLILQALWLASEGVEWTPKCIPDDYQPWVTEQVIPIRNMRRRLKTQWVDQRGLGFEDFRQQVKKLELQAEQYALAILFQQSNIVYGANQKRKNVLPSNFINIAEHFKISSESILKLLGFFSN